jgi:hypothetical protein
MMDIRNVWEFRSKASCDDFIEDPHDGIEYDEVYGVEKEATLNGPLYRIVNREGRGWYFGPGNQPFKYFCFRTVDGEWHAYKVDTDELAAKAAAEIRELIENGGTVKPVWNPEDEMDIL